MSILLLYSVHAHFPGTQGNSITLVHNYIICTLFVSMQIVANSRVIYVCIFQTKSQYKLYILGMQTKLSTSISISRQRQIQIQRQRQRQSSLRAKHQAGKVYRRKQKAPSRMEKWRGLDDWQSWTTTEGNVHQNGAKFSCLNKQLKVK